MAYALPVRCRPLFFRDCAATLAQLAAGKKERWLDFYRYLLKRRALAAHPLAKEIFIREILYAYRRLCTD